jgi:hypothetical protein
MGNPVEENDPLPESDPILAENGKKVNHKNRKNCEKI